jgi:hypothetical protein
MTDITKLMTLLQPHLGWHRARLFCFAALVLALIRVRSVCLVQLAQVLNPRRSDATNYRRLQRFLALFDFEEKERTRLLLALRPGDTPLTLVLDRTEWKIGSKRVNLLVVGYLLEGFVVPLRWVDLDKAGASNETERIDLLDGLLKDLGPTAIDALVADREFIGEQFFRWMIQKKLRFVIRIRKNARMRHRGKGTISRAGDEFAALALGGRRRLREKRVIYGHAVYVVAAREAEEPWILVTNERPKQALALYAKRWAIETTFAAFKSRGFDLESTHIKEAARLEKLVAVLSVALVWAIKVSQWRSRAKPIALKRHGRRAVSVFRHGLDYLRRHLIYHNRQALIPAFQVLSCT